MRRGDYVPEKYPRKLDKDDVRPRLRELRAGGLDPQDPSVLHEIVLGLKMPGESLAWLAAYDLDPDVSDGAIAVLFHVLWNECEEQGLIDHVREQAGPVLRKAMQNPNVPDKRKLSMGPLYGACMGDVSDQEYRGFFKDFQGATNRMIAEAIEGVSGTPESIDAVLTAMMSMAANEADVASARYETTHMLAMRMADVKPGVAAAISAASLYMAFIQGISAENLENSILLMEQTQCPEALWFLDDMGRWPAMGMLGEKARRAAAKLRLMGVQSDCGFHPVFSHGLVSAPDGAGARQLSLYFRTPEGGMDMVAILFKQGLGIKDAICVYEEGAEREDELRASLREVPFAACSLDYARELIEDALVSHEENETPLPEYWAVCRPYLGLEPLVAKRRSADLSPYKLDLLPPESGLLRESKDMVDDAGFGGFLFTSDKAYEFVADCLPKRSLRLPKNKFAQFLEMISKEEQQILLSLMAQVLEVEAMAGRGIFVTNRLAANVWSAMVNGHVPFTEVPYVRALAELSIEMIIHNLRMGFRTQTEVDQANLDTYWSDDDEL